MALGHARLSIIGLQNGDTLLRINGHDVSSPDKALEAYTTIRGASSITLDIERRGKPLSDSQLSQMLEEQGIQVARRTVAKYREALKIAPASLRRAL